MDGQSDKEIAVVRMALFKPLWLEISSPKPHQDIQ